MSIDIWRNYSSEYIKNLTPTLNSLENFKNLTCYKKDVWEIISETDIEAKSIIENLLKTGLIIKDEKNYQGLVKLWKIHNIININSAFNDINDWKSFIISQNNIENGFPHPFIVFDKNEKWDIVRLWFIGNDWNFVNSPLRNKRTKLIHTATSPVMLEIETENPKTQIPEQKITPEIEKPDLEHVIKKWEYLWKIISEKYHLHSEKDKNAIWQIMEIIKKDPRNKKAIKDIDTIFIWEKLYLPKNIKLHQWKWKEDREIKITKKEAK